MLKEHDFLPKVVRAFVSMLKASADMAENLVLWYDASGVC